MTTPQENSDHRWLLVLALYIETAMGGVLLALAEGSAPHYLNALMMASTAALWTILDARRLHRRIIHIAQLLVMFFWPIAVPIYLIWTRRVRGLGWAILHVTALFLTAGISSVIAKIAAYGIYAFPGR